MRKANDKSIKDAIEQMLNVYKIKQKFDETSVIAHWARFVGTPVANRTKKIYVSQKRLFVHIESSVVKNELLMMKEQIITKINEEAGVLLIEDIIFL